MSAITPLLPPTPQDYPSIRQALRDWWRAHHRVFPWRQSRDPYHVLLAEMLLQKTQVAKVEPSYLTLVSMFPTVEALSVAPIRDLEEILRPLGLIKRARYLRESAAAIVARFRGRVPKDRTELKSLPGVGDYTANAVLCFAYRQPVPIVDGAMARVIRRIFGLSSEKGAWEDPVVWRTADELLDRAHPVEHNYALLDLAATICLLRHPLHDRCPVRQWCLLARQVSR